ncbi:hypothetical protein M8818_007066 [Zalaria obscura]|uniref:Uncharacterized protein n=1 Tax=Zalaria obscura TaxID=2024903 RepID=A0ACC3S3X8_9PEZI
MSDYRTDKLVAAASFMSGAHVKDPSETEGLLYDDTRQPQYGATGQGGNAPQPDPEELRKEREGLERICAETSGELIDVLYHNATLPGSKMANDYPHLLNKHFPSRSDTSSPKSIEEDEEAWLNSTENGDKPVWEEVKGLTHGALIYNLNEPAEANSALKKSLKAPAR